MRVFFRAWCLWEIYCTHFTGSKLEVAVPADESAGFEAAFLRNFESVNALIAAVDVRRSEAFNAQDRALIFEVVERCVGYDAINKAIHERLRDWLMSYALSAVGKADKSNPETFKLQDRVADLIGMYGHGRERFEVIKGLRLEALGQRDALFGRNHPEALESKNSVGHMLMNNPSVNAVDANQGLAMLEEVLAARLEMLGPHHPDTLKSMQMLAFDMLNCSNTASQDLGRVFCILHL